MTDRGQKKSHSMIEIVVGTGIGFGVALLTQLAVFPLFGIQTSHGENFAIAAIFTVVSILRGYCVRRLFNWIHVRGF